MEQNLFKNHAAVPGNPDYEKLVERKTKLYQRKDDMRSPFSRDYTRILHSLAYRRLKHKTQVFYNVGNDHICTRMEHVAHVESVSNTIAEVLGLNTRLTRAIATGHDVGHAPFGHQGEVVLSEISKKYLGEDFWHEKNGLHFVDDIELLENPYKVFLNLDLTYAVRDGIISHCGEVDENGLRPRSELIDLCDFKNAGQFMPATWEGCVVKVSDKIAYLGRDIEDAISLGFIDDEAKEKLLNIARANDRKVLNTTVIINNMITDLCSNSTPKNGICFSESFLEQINEIKKYNYKYIYKNPRFKPYLNYSKLVINEIFDFLLDGYKEGAVFSNLEEKARYCPFLAKSFKDWVVKYCHEEIIPKEYKEQIRDFYDNKKIYAFLDEISYIRAIVDFISGMTDRFAVEAFGDLLDYKMV